MKKNFRLALSTWDEKEIEAANKVLNSGNFTMGKNVVLFEEQFAQYIGTNYAVMFNSGSSANLAMLQGAKYMKGTVLSEGDRVIVPAVSWSTTFFPIHQSGLILDFIDINPLTLNMDADHVESIITPKTKAIFAVNLLGNPAELEKLQKIAKKNNLILLEDNCESLGAEINGKKTGSFGLAGSHSFFFSHHICTMEGGMVTTDSKELYEAMISLRAHGWLRGLEDINSVHNKSNNSWEDLYKFVLPGFNLRPTEISGAIGSVQLEKFPKFLNTRRQNAEAFKNSFGNEETVQIQSEHGESSWFGFSIILKGELSEKRNDLVAFFAEKQIDSRPIVAGNFTRNPVMKHLKVGKLPNLPNADEVHDKGLFLGNHHLDSESEIEWVHSEFKKFLSLHKH
jgi:CDP-6-deoxy-D-xylo-4-hexulose-3-dehydrase